MRTRILALLLGPLVLLATACADQIVTAPQEALFNKKDGGESGGGETVYEIVNLGALDGNSSSWAVAINDENVIVGSSWSGGGSPYVVGDDSKVFRWNAGDMVDLGHGLAHGINIEGALVASREDGLFVGQGDGWTPLNGSSRALSGMIQLLNDGGTVTGPLSAGGFGVWAAGDYSGDPDLLGLPAWCEEWTDGRKCSSPRGFAINGAGDIVGDFVYSYPGGFYGLAAIWFAGDYGNPTWLPSGYPYYSWARGVNDVRWVVGSINRGPAVVWIPDSNGDYGAPVELLPISGYGHATAISEPDEGGNIRIVGFDSDGRALTWTVSESGNVNGPVNLKPPPGYRFARARAISRDGWIVGNATKTGGNSGAIAVLWRPVQSGRGDDGGGGDEPCKPHPRTGECR